VKWIGKCPLCGSWDSFQEELATTDEFPRTAAKPLPLTEASGIDLERIRTDGGEFDKVLGGGLVKGEVVLVGGEPGVGKSTLLLQITSHLAKHGKVLYVSAEESVEQVSLRAQRLKLNFSNVYIVNEDNLEEVLTCIKEGEFSFFIVDSIQVIYHPRFGTQRGSINQLKGCANFLARIAKTMSIPVFIIGHVTKEGAISGPKLLEHIVDCVLYFEGENISDYRILRTVKNRFGPTGEIGVFQMTHKGLCGVTSLADLFLPHREAAIPGSSVVCVVEGARPILLEIQSLVSKAGFGIVRRKVSGFDYNKFSLLVAMIEKRLKVHLSNEDVFLNVAGGVKIDDPAADLGAVLSIISSYKEKNIPHEFVFLGEVGLGGELRAISNIGLRLKEVERGGFTQCIIPQANSKEAQLVSSSLAVKGFDTVEEVIKLIWR